MEIAPLENLPHCKSLWLVISGTTCRCDKELVQDEIKAATKLLQEGLTFYKKFTDASLQDLQKINPPARMFDFISKLAPLLNLDGAITWDLVCNFLLFEYRNSAETFASLLADVTSMKTLVNDVWNFYYSERLTLIKCLKLMVEYRDNKRHPHWKMFQVFFDDVLLGNLLESLQKQIEELKFINPATKSQLFTEEHLHSLYKNSLIEMRELLHVVTIILNDIHIADDKFSKIYESIIGEPRRLTSTKSHEDKEALGKRLEEIQHSQVALIMIGLDVTKHNDMYDWIKGVSKTMQDVFEQKCIRESSVQNGPVLLAWMLANYAIESDNVETLNRYKPFGIKALQLDVFRYLQGLLDSEMIREDTHYASVVRNSVYNTLSLFTEFIDEERLLSMSGIFNAVSSCLRYPETAARFWKEQNDGLWVFYKLAVESFPYKFEPLTLLASGLASAGPVSAKEIANRLDDLTSLTLETPRHRDNYTPFRPYEKECTIQRNAFGIPPETAYTLLETTQKDTQIIMWRVKANYWDAFHHKIEQLFLHAGGGISNVSGMETNLPEDVTLGYKLLEILISMPDMSISTGMVIPTELSFEIINRFSYSSLPLNIYKIVSSCISVTSKLVLDYPEDILLTMRAGIFPRFNNWYLKPLEFAQAMSFDGGLVASWLSGIETIQHSYPILSAYLDTLSSYLAVKHSETSMYTIEIPGMVFLLQSVLPKLDTWYFKSNSERIDLWLKSVMCLHRALDSNLPRDDKRNELQLIVAHSLLYLEPRHALLKLVRTGERMLHNKMLTETDWISGRGFKLIKSVQLALSVVNRLLMIRKSLDSAHDERSPLEIALYSSPSLPNGLLIVPTIVDYLYVWFSPSLQAMAVRLLKKFAEGFSMSLLVCMGMDGTTIRETFASRLMSPTCSVEVKVAIIELVTVCLERQPGLTEALFNIMHQAERKRIFPRPADEFLTEGCSQFLHLYLMRISSEEYIVYDRLYDSAMNLLRAMWYHQNEILVNFFRKRPKFWSHLLAPLFRDLVSNVKGYSQLIDIITLELFKNSALEADFTQNLTNLLNKRSNHWEKLVRYVLQGDLSDDDSEISSTNQSSATLEDKSNMQQLYESNLESWYHFIEVLTNERLSKTYVMDPVQAHLLTNCTFDALLAHIKRSERDVKTVKITMLLASLALHCVNAWKLMCVGNSQVFKEKLRELTQEIVQSYRSYTKPLRQTLLSVLLGSLHLIRSTVAEDVAMIDYLLGLTCDLAAGELKELRETAANVHRTTSAPRTANTTAMASAPEEIKESQNMEILKGIRECTPATLAICLVTQLLRPLDFNKQRKRKATCMQLGKMIPELVSCLAVTLQHQPYFRFSRASLGLLGIIARSPYAPQPFSEDAIAKMWLALIPPVDIKYSMLETIYQDHPGSQWRCQDWWLLYSLGLDFITGLVMYHNSAVYIPQIVLFLGSHEHQLQEVSTLLRHTADPVAADLIQSLTDLVSSLNRNSLFWESIQPTVRQTLINCLYLAYDSTVNLLLRPRILKFIIDGISMENAEELQSCDERLPSGELKLLVNKLIVINSTCAQNFVRISPKLNSLIDTIFLEDENDSATMAEINFGPPQMNMCSGPRLTYGTIISSTQLFIQALHFRLLSSQQTQSTSTLLPTSSSQQSSKDDEQSDLAKKEWEKAAPSDHLRKLHTCKDLRKILRVVGAARSGLALSSTSGQQSCEFTSYVSGLDVTMPLLSSPRLVRRPYDPLICENTILSRATVLVPGRHVTKGSVSQSGSSVSPAAQPQSHRPSDSWFSSMEENNTRLALEVNLFLILCQALDGVKSPRLALRDRQLISRETATEVGIFYDFLELRGTPDSWQIKASLIDADHVRAKFVYPADEVPIINAKLKEGSTVDKVPVCALSHNNDDELGSDVVEERLDENVLGPGTLKPDTSQFLALLGKLLKYTSECMDST